MAPTPDRVGTVPDVQRRTVLRSIGAAAVLGVVADAAAGSGDAGGSTLLPESADFAVRQGGECTSVVPLSGDAPVEELYDLRIPSKWTGDNGATDPGSGPYFQSNGTTDLQRGDVTISFLYDGPNGLSLVVVHDSGANATDGGAVSWTLREVPSDAEWAVKDDLYLDPETGEQASTNYDNWDVGDSTHTVDWTWGDAATDGGALRASDGDLSVVVEPAFNEAAALWGEHYSEDPITDWQFLSFPDGRDSPVGTSLALDRPVRIESGPCESSASAGAAADVEIDVRPGEGGSPINPRSRGVIPVAVGLPSGIAPEDVDVGSLRFGPPRVVDDGGGATPAHDGHAEDVDGDGEVDLVLHFRTQQAGFEAGDETATLVGGLHGGGSISATASVTTVGGGDDADGDGDGGNGDDGDDGGGRGNDDEDRGGDDDGEDDEADDDRGRGNGDDRGRGNDDDHGRGNDDDRGGGNGEGDDDDDDDDEDGDDDDEDEDEDEDEDDEGDDDDEDDEDDDDDEEDWEQRAEEIEEEAEERAEAIEVSWDF